MKTGVPDTALNDLTGLLTPPGISCSAVLYSFFDFVSRSFISANRSGDQKQPVVNMDYPGVSSNYGLWKHTPDKKKRETPIRGFSPEFNLIVPVTREP